MLEWIAAISGVLGAILVASNCRFSGYGFLLFLVSSVTWSMCAYASKQDALLINQLGFVAINLLGVYRWLIADWIRPPAAQADMRDTA